MRNDNKDEIRVLYIATAAMIHPETLSMQLTHLTPWLREDTFGILCFAISFFFLLYLELNPRRVNLLAISLVLLFRLLA